MAPTIAKRFIRRICRAHRTVERMPEKLQQCWKWLRFGDLTESVKSVDGGVVSEIEYRGRHGKIVGYWAYGSFDPVFPYRG